jgi:hypothetical protein
VDQETPGSVVQKSIAGMKMEEMVPIFMLGCRVFKFLCSRVIRGHTYIAFHRLKKEGLFSKETKGLQRRDFLTLTYKGLPLGRLLVIW